MTHPRQADLAIEAERSLAAVAVFRAEGNEPKWQLESGAPQRGPATTRPLSRVLFYPTAGRDR
jgi:hypothetical protein